MPLAGQSKVMSVGVETILLTGFWSNTGGSEEKMNVTYFKSLNRGDLESGLIIMLC